MIDTTDGLTVRVDAITEEVTATDTQDATIVSAVTLLTGGKRRRRPLLRRYEEAEELLLTGVLT